MVSEATHPDTAPQTPRQQPVNRPESTIPPHPAPYPVPIRSSILGRHNLSWHPGCRSRHSSVEFYCRVLLNIIWEQRTPPAPCLTLCLNSLTVGATSGSYWRNKLHGLAYLPCPRGKNAFPWPAGMARFSDMGGVGSPLLVPYL